MRGGEGRKKGRHKHLNLGNLAESTDIFLGHHSVKFLQKPVVFQRGQADFFLPELVGHLRPLQKHRDVYANAL